MAANILHQVPGVLQNRGASLFAKSELSVPFSFSSTVHLRGRVSQTCVPLTAAFINGSGRPSHPPVARNNNFIVYAESVSAVPESEDEIDIQNEVASADEALEVFEESKPSPRKPRVKLGQVIEILNKRAVEAVEKERPTPDIRTGDIVELRLEVPENKRRFSVYKGIVMSRQNAGIHTTIRIRRIIAGVGMEIVFPLFMQDPKTSHWQAAKRILRYLKGTSDFGLYYKPTSEFQLTGYTDSDWAGDIDDRKSTSGYAFSMGSAALAWSTKKQNTVSLSTAEAEYKAAVLGACESIWLRRLLQDFQIKQQGPTKIWCDNQSAIQMTKNPVFHGRTKHIETQYHFIRELVQAEQIELTYCSTEDQTTDIFTKALGKIKFEKFRDDLGVIHIGLMGENVGNNPNVYALERLGPLKATFEGP